MTAHTSSSSARSVAKPNLLFISPVMPALTGNGPAMRAGIMLEALAADHDVHLLVIPVVGAPSGSGVDRWASRWCARLAVHRDDAPYLRAGRPRERMTFWGMADWLPPALVGYVLTCAGGELRLLEHGEIIAGLTVVHGPGHTPGSIGLWSAAESALFTGDILNNERGVRMPPWSVNHSHKKARLAPHRLSGLRYERAFFGHGPAIVEGADRRIDAFLRRQNPQPGTVPIADQPR